MRAGAVFAEYAVRYDLAMFWHVARAYGSLMKEERREQFL
jgi:hypothetical protein